MAGRKPKPGGDRARSGPAQIEFDRLSPHDGTPVPPEYFDEDAVYAWVMACRSLIPKRYLSHIDLLALEAFAVAFSRWRREERNCRGKRRRNGVWDHAGEATITPNGLEQQSRARQAANRAFEQVRALGGDLGMTPVARIKTCETAQGDLFQIAPAPAAPSDPDADNEDTARAMTSIFQARPTTLRQ